jgi:hypothetical protein
VVGERHGSQDGLARRVRVLNVERSPGRPEAALFDVAVHIRRLLDDPEKTRHVTKSTPDGRRGGEDNEAHAKTADGDVYAGLMVAHISGLAASTNVGSKGGPCPLRRICREWRAWPSSPASPAT